MLAVWKRVLLCAALTVALLFCLADPGDAPALRFPVWDQALALRPSGDEKEQAAREAEFQKLLSGATLAGEWRLVKDGKLGPERVEKYTLGEVKRSKDGKWTVVARIEYGDKDVKIPVPVQVLWAGDTPVLSVTNLWLPGLGKYTARVMFYRGLYTGSWFGSDYGGLMSGVTVPAEKAAEPVPVPEEKSESR